MHFDVGATGSFRPSSYSGDLSIRKRTRMQAPRSWATPVVRWAERGPKPKGALALQLAEVWDARGTRRFQFGESCQNPHSANIDLLQRQSDSHRKAARYFCQMSQGQTPALFKSRHGDSGTSLCVPLIPAHRSAVSPK